MRNLIAVGDTRNAKLTDGNEVVGATYRPVGKTCPSTCRFLNNGCYAQKGPTNLVQTRARNAHEELDNLVQGGASFVRHNVSGDFFLHNKLDIKYLQSVLAFHLKHMHVVGWAYTHRIADFVRARIQPTSLPDNMTILASVDNERQRKFALRHGWRTARVIWDKSERKRGEVLCRFQIDGTPCTKCQLCWKKHENIKGIVFLKH